MNTRNNFEVDSLRCCHAADSVLSAGFAAFLVSGAAAALAPNLGAVCAARLLGGAGAAAIVPAAQAYIADISSSIDRSRRFVGASMLLAAFASFAVGTFEVGFTRFGGQTLGRHFPRHDVQGNEMPDDPVLLWQGLDPICALYRR